MKDGVYPLTFCGGPAFKVVHRGQESQMYFKTRKEAKQMLWMLQNPEVAEDIVKSPLCDSVTPFSERFEHLRKDYKTGAHHG